MERDGRSSTSPPRNPNLLSLKHSPRAGDALALLAVFATTFVVTAPVFRRWGDVVLNLGPNDSPYISGFAPFYEIENGVVATRWTTYDATIDLPLTVQGGPVDLSFRFSRVFPQTAVVEVYLAGDMVDRFDCRGGLVRVRRVHLAALGPTPLSIRFKADSHERRDRGLRLDWVRLSVGVHGSMGLRGIARWLPALVTAFLYALFRWGGLSRRFALLLTLPWVGAAAVWASWDPFGLAHVLTRIGLPGLVLSVASGAFLRTQPGGRWVVPMVAAGFLIKGAGLFHPTTFYPDVENARDYVTQFKETTGTLAERGVETQKKTNVGYPRNVGGKDYAFPYSPLYFYPFTWLPSAGAVEDGVRVVGLVSAAAETPVVFWIGSAVLGPRVGILAALLSVFLPPAFSRLILALHATLVGHLFDCLVIAAVFALTAHPKSWRPLAAVAGASLASLLSYTSSLFSAGAFLVVVSVLDRRVALRLLGVLGGAVLITVGWLYWPFALLFFKEIVPAVWRDLGASGAVGTGTSGGGLWHALGRIPIFYGFGYPALAVAGLIVVRRRAGAQAFRIVVAYGAAFLLLVGLRAFGGGLFKDLKEIEFAAPLVAILTAASLDVLLRRGRAGLVAAACITIGLVVFGAGKYRDYLTLHRSPVMSLGTWTSEESLGRGGAALDSTGELPSDRRE